MQTTLIHEAPVNSILYKEDMPGINFQQLKNLTDDTGMIQHAIFNIPNRKEGYCIDDNARALLFTVLAQYGDKIAD